ncbi:MAG TPA: IPT/TIG domain-containing protein, partial [Blastocatellia bacterium]|nr:IPT/TIG domain-containing protein [Blastocatellia bacterium]
QNTDGSRTNPQPFIVTRDDLPPPPPPPDVSPQITSFFVYKKVRTKVINMVKAGSKAKKLRLVVTGTDFDANAQLLINGEAVQIESSSATEIVGRFTQAMLAAPGELAIQVRNSTNRTSNTVRLNVVPKR